MISVRILCVLLYVLGHDSVLHSVYFCVQALPLGSCLCGVQGNGEQLLQCQLGNVVILNENESENGVTRIMIRSPVSIPSHQYELVCTHPLVQTAGSHTSSSSLCLER